MPEISTPHFSLTSAKFISVRSEGGLLPTDLLERVAELDKALPGLQPTAFNLTKNERINEYINRSWSRLTSVWNAFRQERQALDPADLGTSLTRQDWLTPLFQELGFGQIPLARADVIGGKSYAISHRWQNVPIQQISFRYSLDRRAERVAGASRLSPHTLLQEYLNRSDDMQWGILTNGLQLRLLRDNARLTRQAYLEFDLECMFDGDAFADFRLLWLVCHATRFLPPLRGDEENQERSCLLELWTKAADDSGVRALDKLRDGVTAAIQYLGRGFLSNPANHEIKRRLRSGELDKQDYYRQLLRLIYRLILLFVTEDRHTLYTQPDAASSSLSSDLSALVYSSFGTGKLREQAAHIRGTRHTDRYEALKTLFGLLGSDTGCPELGIPALGGFLFSPQALPDLDQACLCNQDLYSAVRAMSLFIDSGVRRAVNFANLDAEELGGIYESLLEMHPRLESENSFFELTVAAGNERKTTGSYYTPDSLIQSLLDSALEPVISARLNAADSPEAKAAALLSLRVCDPACGSGHFLLGAARRIAERLASLRLDGDEPSPDDKRLALRDVISNCLYGVDVNPMSAELCKVSLWMESMQPGLPLSFLDSHIRSGNSLVGMGPGMSLADLSIPDEAFEAKTGDDKAIAKSLKAMNRAESSQLVLTFINTSEDLQQYLQLGAQSFESLPELNAADVRRKAHNFAEYEKSDYYRRACTIANFWTAAFFWPLKKQGPAQHFPTQGVFWNLKNGQPVSTELLAQVDDLARRVQPLHWPLIFPTVFDGSQAQGFDCVLGNPPWERIKLQEKEFFAERDPQIAAAPNKAARDRLILTLEKTDPGLKAAFEAEKHLAECTGKFMRDGQRFSLTNVGDMNLYALFAETNRRLMGAGGRAGFIVPAGIVTDDTTQTFFGDLIESSQLASVYHLENREALFPAVDSRQSFVLMTLSAAPVPKADFVFFATNTSHINDPVRRFSLEPAEIALFNPNTRTMPLFRTRADMELSEKLYKTLPILINQQTDENPWGILFGTLFHMSNDSALFSDEPAPASLRLYEGKYLHQFDHRLASFDAASGKVRETAEAEKQDAAFQISSRYYVDSAEVRRRLPDFWQHQWFMAFRDITNATNERTMIASLLPFAGVGNTAPVIFLECNKTTDSLLLLTCFDSLVFDYCARQKIGGIHMNHRYLRQLPVLPPTAYSEKDREFIIPRAFELVYTADDQRAFAEDLWQDCQPSVREIIAQSAGANSPAQPQSCRGPYRWDEERRAGLRAELDAYYARLYGLTRDELRYILDPQEVYGEDFPGETFRVLKNKDISQFGEYRTRRLVLAAWDGFEADGTFAHIQSPVKTEPAALKAGQTSARSQQPPVVKAAVRPQKAATPQTCTADKASARVQQSDTKNPHQGSLFGDTYVLYKCCACGKLLMDFGTERASHEAAVHAGRHVEWKKMS